MSDANKKPAAGGASDDKELDDLLDSEYRRDGIM